MVANSNNSNYHCYLQILVKKQHSNKMAEGSVHETPDIWSLLMFLTSSQTFPCSRETLFLLRKLMKVVSQNLRMGRAGRDHSGCLLQPPCSARVSLEYMAQDCDWMVPEYLQQGKPHSLSEQRIYIYIYKIGVFLSWNGIKQKHADVNRDSQG